MSLQARFQAQSEFRRAHRAATVRSFINRLTRRSVRLCAFTEAHTGGYVTPVRPRTLQEVPLHRVIGSVGRPDNYTPDFLPRRASDEERWIEVRQAIDGAGVPPLELYRRGEHYFVQDGHHRMSVFRSLGLTTAEAYVTEVRA